jgi:hypothetical protein
VTIRPCVDVGGSRHRLHIDARKNHARG